MNGNARGVRRGSSQQYVAQASGEKLEITANHLGGGKPPPPEAVTVEFVPVE